MTTANAKLRRLAAVCCFVLLLLVLRAAYAYVLAFASSAWDSKFYVIREGDECVDHETSVAIYYWSYYSQEYPAIISALSSAMLTVLSLQYTLTPSEKKLLMTGLSAQQHDHSVESLVQKQLNDHVGLNQLL
jgi:hypothetical protein